jgi:hypothetical protein
MPGADSWAFIAGLVIYGFDTPSPVGVDVAGIIWHGWAILPARSSGCGRQCVACEPPPRRPTPRSISQRNLCKRRVKFHPNQSPNNIRRYPGGNPARGRARHGERNQRPLFAMTHRDFLRDAGFQVRVTMHLPEGSAGGRRNSIRVGHREIRMIEGADIGNIHGCTSLMQ